MLKLLKSILGCFKFHSMMNSKDLLIQINKIMATQAELKTQLDNVTTLATKILGEIQALKTSVPADVQASADAATAAVQAVEDALNPVVTPTGPQG